MVGEMRKGLMKLRRLELMTAEDLGAIDAMRMFLEDAKRSDGLRWCGCSL